jgi:hypothetical protein
MVHPGYIALAKCDMPGWMRGFFSVLLCGIILHVNANAEEFVDISDIEVVEQSIEQPAIPVPEAGLLEALDGPRDYLSDKIVEYGKGIDQFFGEERYFQEHNKSVVQLEVNETLSQSGNNLFAVQGQAKLDLPAAQRRFRLVLEANPEKKSTEEVRKDLPTQSKDARKPDQYAASLRYEREEESNWHFSADSGAQFQFPLDPFVRTRGSYSIPVAEWRLKLAESVFWFSTIGLGETTQFEMERVLSAPLLFRATSTATCFEFPQRCDLRQDLSVFHTLNERAALLYQASVIGVDKPVLEETEFVLLMRFRYRLHKEWVFFEGSPQLFFPKTDDFKLNAQLNLRLEFLFGGTK